MAGGHSRGLSAQRRHDGLLQAPARRSRRSSAHCTRLDHNVHVRRHARSAIDKLSPASLPRLDSFEAVMSTGDTQGSVAAATAACHPGLRRVGVEDASKPTRFQVAVAVIGMPPSVEIALHRNGHI
ncbi:hypothetical protein OH77DRAFT_1418466 [Trametes cingulata]|nr:hypothetical protein OH77DRAFT_1418466 [Trametes cingulata]